MIELIGLTIARVALAVTAVLATIFAIRHRHDHRSPNARKVRRNALWALATGVVGLVVFFVAGEL